jgi:hypothetical protein
MVVKNLPSKPTEEDESERNKLSSNENLKRKMQMAVSFNDQEAPQQFSFPSFASFRTRIGIPDCSLH